ncbi:hypothetical protein [Bacillus cereus]|uniref:Uncharacterized protein n=1 Tax=Bacillus cereus TaxID=1396 RepID=A0A1S9UHP8_BACCE|nr:hypothetical protein [Bacillus cereus]OOR21735.1 hypothetical protein BW892_22350 [Bacillus cereus]
MIHESNKVNDLVITEGKLNFEDIYSKSYFPKEYEEDLKKANLLLIPYEGFKTIEDPVFPEETMKFYEFIKDYSDERLIGDICISDDNYVELELHADLISLANMVIDTAVLPITLGLITNYISQKLQERKGDLKIKVNMTVVDGEKSTTISYEGDADKFEETIKAVNQINN